MCTAVCTAVCTVAWLAGAVWALGMWAVYPQRQILKPWNPADDDETDPDPVFEVGLAVRLSAYLGAASLVATLVGLVTAPVKWQVAALGVAGLQGLALDDLRQVKAYAHATVPRFPFLSRAHVASAVALALAVVGGLHASSGPLVSADKVVLGGLNAP